MHDNASIELATFADACEIGILSKNEIEYGLGWRYTPEKIKGLIKNPSSNVIVARVNRKLTGFGVMTYYDDQANLDLLAVKSKYRREKFGTNIVSWLENVALTAGVMNVFVQVRAINKQAIQFYRRAGYVPIEERLHFYNDLEPGIIMSKSLRKIFPVPQSITDLNWTGDA